MNQQDSRSLRKERIISEAERSILLILLFGFVLGLTGVIGFPITIAGVECRLIFIGTLIACASFITGFFTGTLFGIPKRNNDGNRDYSLNNSLVEISEWLTKIIVGLGLVNLKQVPGYLLSMGKYVKESSNLISASADVYSMCVVVYFAVLGLYIGYNYMRMVLSAKYKMADDNLIAALEDQKQKTAELKVVNKELLNEVNKPSLTSEKVKQIDYVDQMLVISKKKLREGLRKNKEIDDPQKGMWGGENEKNNRKLSAIVTEKSQGLYKILLKLESTDEAVSPLEDGEVVLFALHDTWNPPYRLVNIDGNAASLELYAYGSFTVGVLADKGKTELELDLAEIPGVSRAFKEN